MNIERMSGSEIAVLDLIAVTAAGERGAVRLCLGPPVPDGAGVWPCPLALEGLHADLPSVLGEDPLQSLCLALALAAALLRDVLEKGGRLEYAAGGDFPLDAYFGWLGEF